ncbi:MAG: glutamate racemase [Oscillospiraceae bacterium]|nr:glutamate racemase [Oscillospiraceae bacterium]MCL2278456.1 glutamate racemase [Oscillospiraceae bacterium]
MDNRAIGIFDSGLGGLTMVKKLLELLPNEDLVYLGDTGRVPYGSRSVETIIKYAGQDAEFLALHNIKTMVVACNTVCSVAMDELIYAYDMPIYEVITAPAVAAAKHTKNGKIGVIGTAATIRSEAYKSALTKISEDLEVYMTACPLFVPLVEEGFVSADNEIAVKVAEQYLKTLKEANIDTLILGCTHYPLLSDIISNVMGETVKLIDSGTETAQLVARELQQQNLLSDANPGGGIKYFVTDSIEGFSYRASRFLHSDIGGKVQKVTLE